MSEADSQKYILEIAEIIAPLNPLIIYLEENDEKAAVEKVMSQRGNGWLDAVIAYHTEQGYGKENGLSGFDGYISCLEERQRREKRILSATGFDFRMMESRPERIDF